MKPITTIEEANKAIRHGWIAGTLVSALSIGIFCWQKFDPWFLADSIIMSALTVGVFFRSRTCAIALLTYYVIGKVFLWIRLGIGIPLPGTRALTILIIIFAFAYAFFESVKGTLAYQRLAKSSLN
jgi:hypothetical protein